MKIYPDVPNIEGTMYYYNKSLANDESRNPIEESDFTITPFFCQFKFKFLGHDRCYNIETSEMDHEAEDDGNEFIDTHFLLQYIRVQDLTKFVVTFGFRIPQQNLTCIAHGFFSKSPRNIGFDPENPLKVITYQNLNYYPLIIPYNNT